MKGLVDAPTFGEYAPIYAPKHPRKVAYLNGPQWTKKADFKRGNKKIRTVLNVCGFRFGAPDRNRTCITPLGGAQNRQTPGSQRPVGAWGWKDPDTRGGMAPTHPQKNETPTQLQPAKEKRHQHGGTFGQVFACFASALVILCGDSGDSGDTA